MHTVHAGAARALSVCASAEDTLPVWLPFRAVTDAADRLAGHIVRTPLLHAPALGRDLWLKAETFQATGAFKERGALNLSLIHICHQMAAALRAVLTLAERRLLERRDMLGAGRDPHGLRLPEAEGVHGAAGPRPA